MRILLYTAGFFLLAGAMARGATATAPGYAGMAACAKCHAEIHRQWTHSRHSKMVQPATKESVKGDFKAASVRLRDLTYLLRERDGVYYITETYLTGKPQEHRVDYTLGNRRIQHYLTTLDDGKIIVLPPSWDVLRKGWFHNLDIADPDQPEGVEVQVWNKNCYSCHVSQQEKNFNAETNEYKTAWLDFGTNCERCHGPGKAHVEHYSSPTPPKGKATDIVVQTRLDAARNTMVCAQCHSFRDIYARGFAAGANYYDYFLPILEYDQPKDGDPAYWPDGRTRRFSNDSYGLWQSECFLKGGVTCVACHTTVHDVEIEKNPQLRPTANALCTRCHTAIGAAVPAHTHHAAGSAGSSCIECHMPRTVYSIKAEIRDHSMTIPVPENTIRHGIPNACNICHKDRDAAWTLKNMNAWYGDRSRQKLIRRADAFALAAKGDPGSIPGLLAILAEPSEGPLVRANAAGHLSQFSEDPTVFTALVSALKDSEDVVRSVASLRIHPGPADRQTAVKALVAALGDRVAPVRIGATATLVSLGVHELPGEDGKRFEAAKKLFRARADANNDDAEQDIGAGRFYYLTGEMDKAVTAFQTSLRIDPNAPAQYLLAAAYVQKGEIAKARDVLLTIPAGNPQYEKAQRLLKAIAEQARIR
ncbi:MAG TPA: ammonia-forming cytochrome c nitrite reductase subunit c552 [Bryobacteraceae bacterium]|nr:ammonia-forming cytochrome c nitrite reductase subunit c552 [Bryobacteraceae bacterium]